MQSGQLILALSNPIPETDPDLAFSSGAACATDGQIVNNVLGFPGILRGAVDSNARLISHEMHLAAADVAKQAVKQELARAEFVTYVNE